MAKRLKKKVKKLLPSLPAAQEKETEKIKKTKIRVIGIGGGGGNIVSELSSKVKKASFFVANTDRQALREVKRRVNIFQFGENLTHGLGTGMNPEIAETAVLAEKEGIKKLLKGQDLVILIATLGGGVSSGAAPFFAKISKNLGNLTFGIFTLPFKFEGEKKMEIAKEALEKLKSRLNALLVIPNERIFQVIDKNTPLKSAFSAINKNLAEGLEGLIEMIYQPGLINIDFADLRTVLQGQGRLAFLNTVEIEGKKLTEEMIKKVVSNPLYSYSIRGAKGVLFNIVGEKNLTLSEMNQISKGIYELSNKEAKLIFGISPIEKSLAKQGKIKITLLATGCGTRVFAKKTKKKKLKKKTILPASVEESHGQPPKRQKKTAKKPVEIKPQKRKFPQLRLFRKKQKKTKISQPEKEASGTRALAKGEDERSSSTSASAGSLEKTKTDSEGKIEIKIRKNALQIKKEIEEQERELLKREEQWEAPAFLRKIRPSR